MANKKNLEKGSILIQAIVFTGVFLIIVVGLLQYVQVLDRASYVEKEHERAYEIAESGSDYYRWVLAHDPEDYCDGNLPCDGGPQHGPYTHEFRDPQGDVIGHYELTITEPAVGSTIVTIQSTGYLDDNPGYTRTIETRYGIPTIADYIFLSNSNMAFSATSYVTGKVHSNGGIRFDGTNENTVTSPQETYLCEPIHGCSYPYENKPGVWGSGGPQELWEFPPTFEIPDIPFSNFLIDIESIKDTAETKIDDLYEGENYRGFHLTFNADGTITTRRVTRTWWYDDAAIREETDAQTIDMPANGLLFAGEQTWVDGVVNGRVTLAVGEQSDDDIIIQGNITYANGTGTDVLGLIALDDIEFSRWLPEDTSVFAAMLAQNGKIYRDLDWPYTLRDSLTITGAMLYNETGYFKSTSGGSVTNGYIDTYYNYDNELTYSPPPAFPTEGTYQLLSWQEI